MYADQKAYEKWKEELETSCFNNHGDKCSQLAICYFYENKLKKAYARAQKGCDLNSGEACYHLYDIASALKLKDEALNAEQKACDLKVFQVCNIIPLPFKSRLIFFIFTKSLQLPLPR